METPEYQERVTKRVLSETQPELDTPIESPVKEISEDFEHIESSLKRWFLVLVVILAAIITFSIVDAYLWVMGLWQTQPLLGGTLSLVLFAVIFALGYLVTKEWAGLSQLKKVSESVSLVELQTKGDRETTVSVIKLKVSQISQLTPAYRLHQACLQTIKPHHTNEEVLQIYNEKVQKPLLQKANQVLKKESVGAGAIAFISPNSLLQTMGIIWVSMRTLKKVAYVYGIRPSLIGNLTLFRIALENLAASSLADLATDEIANQLGGSLGDKVLANSADGVTAFSLNQRLGKALIKKLSNNL